MNRYAKLTFAAAALALSALSAAPASAADIVVKLGGKTPDQISAELEKAATVICLEQKFAPVLMSLTNCVDAVFNDAVAQLPPTIEIPAR
jgi:hypothetical protein